TARGRRRRVRLGTAAWRLSTPERRQDEAVRWLRPARGHREAPLHLRGPRPRRREDRDRQGGDARLADVPGVGLHPWAGLPRGLVRELSLPLRGQWSSISGRERARRAAELPVLAVGR